MRSVMVIVVLVASLLGSITAARADDVVVTPLEGLTNYTLNPSATVVESFAVAGSPGGSGFGLAGFAGPTADPNGGFVAATPADQDPQGNFAQSFARASLTQTDPQFGTPPPFILVAPDVTKGPAGFAGSAGYAQASANYTANGVVVGGPGDLSFSINDLQVDGSLDPTSSLVHFQITLQDPKKLNDNLLSDSLQGLSFQNNPNPLPPGFRIGTPTDVLFDLRVQLLGNDPLNASVTLTLAPGVGCSVSPPIVIFAAIRGPSSDPDCASTLGNIHNSTRWQLTQTGPNSSLIYLPGSDHIDLTIPGSLLGTPTADPALTFAVVVLEPAGEFPARAAVPEPSTWLLLGSGIVALVFWRRRQLV